MHHPDELTTEFYFKLKTSLIFGIIAKLFYKRKKTGPQLWRSRVRLGDMAERTQSTRNRVYRLAWLIIGYTFENHREKGSATFSL